MISPEPQAHAAAASEPLRPVAGGLAAGGLATGGLATGGLAAAGLGAALATLVLAAAVSERYVLPFGAAGPVGHAAAAVAFVVAALAAARAVTPRASFVVTTLAAAALAIVVSLQWWSGPFAIPSSLLLAAASLGLVAGTLPRRWPIALAAAGTAAALAAVWQRVALAEPGPLFAASIASALFALLTLPVSVRLEVPLASPGRRWLARGGWLAAAALWSGAMPWRVVGTEGAAGLLGIVAVVGFALAVAIRTLSTGIVAAALGASALLFVPTGSGDAPGRQLELARSGDCAAVFVRGCHELQLQVGGRVVDAAGPDRHEAPLLATLVHALAPAGDRVLVLGPGTGQVPATLRELQRHEVDVVDWRPAARSLRARLVADGPVAPPAGALAEDGLPERLAALSVCLDALPAASRQAIVVAEPLAAVTAVVDAGSAQRALRAVVGDGLVLQAIALDRVVARDLHALLAAAVAAHPWNGVFVVGDAAVLVSALQAPAWDALTPFPSWPAAARWLAHRAHCGDLADLQRALLGTLGAAAAPDSSWASALPGRPAALAVLRAWLQPAAEVPVPAGGSTLLRWTALQAELRQAAATLRTLGPDVGSRAEAQQIAARFLPVGAPTAILQAALGVVGADGAGLCSPALASRRAHAIDPTFFADVPACCRELPTVRDEVGALEDLARLPALPRLSTLCRGDGPLAVALRARFPSACARALVAELATAPLAADAQQALRELVDPFVLAEATLVLRQRGGERELLGLWRGDLAMPAAVASLVHGSRDDQLALAAALRGRRDPSCHAPLAVLLEAPVAAVRRLAAEALVSAVGDRVPYDADWPDSARRAAAERLRSLHNRTP